MRGNPAFLWLAVRHRQPRINPFQVSFVIFGERGCAFQAFIFAVLSTRGWRKLWVGHYHCTFGVHEATNRRRWIKCMHWGYTKSQIISQISCCRRSYRRSSSGHTAVVFKMQNSIFPKGCRWASFRWAFWLVSVGETAFSSYFQPMKISKNGRFFSNRHPILLLIGLHSWEAFKKQEFEEYEPCNIAICEVTTVSAIWPAIWSTTLSTIYTHQRTHLI